MSAEATKHIAVTIDEEDEPFLRDSGGNDILSQQPSKPVSDKMVNPVYFYYPNLIGYIRVIALFISGYIAFSKPFYATLFYIVSMGLDAIDGTGARACGQS